VKLNNDNTFQVPDLESVVFYFSDQWDELAIHDSTFVHQYTVGRGYPGTYQEAYQYAYRLL